MTVLTGDAGHKGVDAQQLSVDNRARGVAAKAGHWFAGRKPSPEGFVESSWINPKITNGDSEPAKRRVETDETFIVDARSLKDPGARAIAKCPADREGDGLSSVGHGIGALTIASFHNVGVAGFLKREPWVELKTGSTPGGCSARPMDVSGCVCAWEE